jgi:DNA gyrase subunit A
MSDELNNEDQNAESQPEAGPNHGLIREQMIVEEMQESYLTYAMSTIMDRALPDVRDGLKPSQRRILVAMHDLNLGPRAQHRKCAKIVGDTSGNYHPHGDQTIYPTLVRMGQHWNLRYPLIHPQGNFGSIDGDPPAAMRYTEARMASPAEEMLVDLEYNTVDFQPNYDETRTEPIVLPSKFPNLLVNGSSGIAVGMSTSIPPNNIQEVCDAIIAFLNNPDISIDDLLKIVPGPDFPTGGIICNHDAVRQAYATGRGNLTVRAKLHVETTKQGRGRVVIDEIPYQILKNTITTRIVDSVKRGVIPDVSDIRDESGRQHAVRLVIELKRDADPDVVINQLYHHTPLQMTFVINNIALTRGQPRTLGFKDMVQLYVDHRRDVIRRRTQFLLDKAQRRAHILEGLILALGDIDEIIYIIRHSADPAAARVGLMAKPLRLTERETLEKLLPAEFVARVTSNDQHLTVAQADAILSMQLQRLTGLEIEKLAKEYSDLVEEIRGFEKILADENLILDIIREDMYTLKEKYAGERRTQILNVNLNMRNEDLIPQEQVAVTISHTGYIKRTTLDEYRAQGRGGKGVRGIDAKEGDFVEHLFIADTHDYLLFFTNNGRVYWLKVYEIPEMQRAARGRALANILSMHEGEALTKIMPVDKFDETRYVFFATVKGTVKKTPLEAYSRPRADGIIAINLDEGDALVGVDLTGGQDQIILATREGQAVRFDESEVRSMGRGATGVRGVDLREGDIVVDMAVARPGQDLLTVCENGFGKKTSLEEYRLTHRGGKGVINIKISERNGKVVALKSVNDDNEMVMITQSAQMLRTAVNELREIGRATQGVRLIRVDEGDRVVAVARFVKDENGETAAQAAAAGQPATEGAAPAEPSGPAAASQPPAVSNDGSPATQEEDGPASDA